MAIPLFFLTLWCEGNPCKMPIKKQYACAFTESGCDAMTSEEFTTSDGSLK